MFLLLGSYGNSGRGSGGRFPHLGVGGGEGFSCSERGHAGLWSPRRCAANFRLSSAEAAAPVAERARGLARPGHGPPFSWPPSWSCCTRPPRAAAFSNSALAPSGTFPRPTSSLHLLPALWAEEASGWLWGNGPSISWPFPRAPGAEGLVMMDRRVGMVTL